MMEHKNNISHTCDNPDAADFLLCLAERTNPAGTRRCSAEIKNYLIEKKHAYIACFFSIKK